MRQRSFHSSRLAAAGLLVAGVALQACGSDATGVAGYPASGSFALIVGTSTIPVTSGATAITFIKVTRTGGLTSDIIFDATSEPGLAATVVTTSVADSFAVVFDASATLDPGTYPVIVHAAAVGAPPQRETFAVDVTAPSR